MSEEPEERSAEPQAGIRHVEVHLADEAATEALGRWIGARMKAGQGVGLIGELGAGKTCLVRGLGHGLDLLDPAAVCSPTYLLVVEHPGPLPLVHIDAYLPAKTRGFLLDGGLDYLAEIDGVVAVEWADRLVDLLPAETLWITLQPGMDGRGRQAIMADRTGRAFPWLSERGESGDKF